MHFGSLSTRQPFPLDGLSFTAERLGDFFEGMLRRWRKEAHNNMGEQAGHRGGDSGIA